MAAAIVLASDRNGFHRILLDAEQHDSFTFFFHDFHIGNDARLCFQFYFIDPLGNRFFSKPYADNCAVIVYADINGSSFRIGESHQSNDYLL